MSLKVVNKWNNYLISVLGHVNVMDDVGEYNYRDTNLVKALHMLRITSKLSDDWCFSVTSLCSLSGVEIVKNVPNL